jgi:hypothetical protein
MNPDQDPAATERARDAASAAVHSIMAEAVDLGLDLSVVLACLEMQLAAHQLPASLPVDTVH